MKEEVKKAKGSHNILSGKALFKYDPTLFQDDENAADEKIYEEREEDFEEEEEKKESDNTRKLKDLENDGSMIKSSAPDNEGTTDGGESEQIDTKVDEDLFK